METFFTLLTITFFSILAFFVFFFIFVTLTIFAGKSIKDPEYPPVIGTVLDQFFYFHMLHDHLTETARNRPTFRVLTPGHSRVCTTDTRNVEHVLKNQFNNYSKGKYNLDILRDLFGEGIFAVDGDKWRRQRKVASYEFSTRVLRDFSCSVFRRNAAKLVGVVSEFACAGVVFDMQDALMRMTLDSIFEVGFGVELNCLEGSSKEGIEFMKAFDDSNALLFRRYVDPFWKLKRLLNIGSEATLKKKVETIDNFVHSVIQTKREHLKIQQHPNDKEDILSRFLMENKKNPKNMTEQYLRDIVLNFTLAGKDSTSITLSWFFYMLCKKPLVQEKIVQEVKDVTCSQENKPRIDDFVAKITNDILEKMHYLHAALTETLRLYPAVPVDGRTAETNDILPDGYKLKKGDELYYMPYAMGRMPYIWGQDAKEFKPERWIKDGIFQHESSFKFIAFNAGPRICLGKDFAYRQMKIVSMALLRFFRFKLGNETEKVTYKIMFTLHINKGLPIYAYPRS